MFSLNRQGLMQNLAKATNWSRWNEQQSIQHIWMDRRKKRSGEYCPRRNRIQGLPFGVYPWIYQRTCQGLRFLQACSSDSISKVITSDHVQISMIIRWHCWKSMEGERTENVINHSLKTIKLMLQHKVTFARHTKIDTISISNSWHINAKIWM